MISSLAAFGLVIMGIILLLGFFYCIGRFIVKHDWDFLEMGSTKEMEEKIWVNIITGFMYSAFTVMVFAGCALLLIIILLLGHVIQAII
jgi:hypothetical protein